MLRTALALIAATLPAELMAQDMTEAEMRAIHDRLFTLDEHVDIGAGKPFRPSIPDS